VARKSIGNQILVDAVSNSIERVKGRRPAWQEPGRVSRSIPGFGVGNDFRRGESGRLDVELVRVAVVTGRGSGSTTKTTVAFAEPLMLFIIAAFVGNHFYRDDPPDLHPAGLHQVTQPKAKP